MFGGVWGGRGSSWGRGEPVRMGERSFDFFWGGFGVRKEAAEGALKRGTGERERGWKEHFV